MPAVCTARQAEDLLRQLPKDDSITAELVTLIERCLHTSVRERIDDGALVMVRFALQAVRLRNADNTVLLLIRGNVDGASLRSWKMQHSGTDRLILVFATSASETPLATFPASQGYALFRPDDIVRLLSSDDPLGTLKEHLRRSISKYRLNPFTVSSSTPTNMFFGRRHEIGQLYQSDKMSFAIAGPGRIGKSSLLRQYVKHVRAIDQARYDRFVYIDFFFLPETTDSAIAQRLAMAVNPTKRATEVTLSSLRPFILQQDRLRNGPLEFLCDEVDSVCNTNAFAVLSEIAKDGLCRLIVCGRYNLFEAHYRPDHVLHSRTTLMRLLPLSKADARRLLLEPFRDMGFTFEDEDQFANRFVNETAGYPHLIQYLASELAMTATATGTEFISLTLLEELFSRYETAQLFTAPIRDLSSPLAQYVILTLIEESAPHFTETNISEMIQRAGLGQVPPSTVSAICRELYINNCLAWNNGCYSLATPGLVRFSRMLGLPTHREELRQLIR